MNNPADRDSLSWVKTHNEWLNELRCADHPQHRSIAAKHLVGLTDIPDRIPYLLNTILYDPDPAIREEVRTLLLNIYGSELTSILAVESSDGVPLKVPWLTPCIAADKGGEPSIPNPFSREIERLVSTRDFEGLHLAVRDGTDYRRRLVAVKALGRVNDPDAPLLLAKSILFDPELKVQQAAYEALYEAIGGEKAESLLETVGAENQVEDEDWLMGSDGEEITNISEEEAGFSLFGVDEGNRVRGFLELTQRGKDLKTRILAIEEVSRTADVRVNEVLARVSLFDEESEVRKKAYEVLELRLGDEAKEFQEHVRNDPDLEENDWDDEDQEDELEPLEVSRRSPLPMQQQSPVISEGFNFNPIILIVVGVLIVILIYLLLK